MFTLINQNKIYSAEIVHILMENYAQKSGFMELGNVNKQSNLDNLIQRISSR